MNDESWANESALSTNYCDDWMSIFLSEISDLIKLDEKKSVLLTYFPFLLMGTYLMFLAGTEKRLKVA